MEEYPRNWLPVDSLAVDLSLNFNDYEQAAQLFRHSMQLDPQQPKSPSGLARRIWLWDESRTPKRFSTQLRR